MADINRLLVNMLVLHHAVTPLWDGYSKAWLAQWFSDLGFSRGYGSNTANWSGLINPYTGARSYAMAHFAGQRVVSATPDATDAERAAGYRLVPLVNDPWGQIAWHAGHWETNRASIGIENLGDYRNYTLRDGDCKVIADFWRPQDKALNGNTYVLGHNEIISTICPARIMESRDRIVDLINNPPTPVPAPVPVPTPTPAPTPIKYTKYPAPVTVITTKEPTMLWDFSGKTWGELAAAEVDRFVKGHKIDVVGDAQHPLGGIYLMTAYSFGNAGTTGIPHKTWGVNAVDVTVAEVDPVPVPVPVPEPTPEPTPTPTPEPTPEPEPEPPEEEYPSWFKRFVNAVLGVINTAIDAIKKIVGK